MLLLSQADAHILRYAPLRSPSRALHYSQNPAHPTSFVCIAVLLLSRADAHILRYALLRSPLRALHYSQNPAHL